MKHTKELFSLDGKVAIVTGGRGLCGGSISTGLCEMGAAVVIASRDGEACEGFAQTLRDRGYDAIGLSLDLSDDVSIKALAMTVFDRTVSLTGSQMALLHEAFHGIDPRVINPGCWYNHT